MNDRILRAKRYLRQLKDLEDVLPAMRAELDAARQRSVSCGSPSAGTVSSGHTSPDRIPGALASIMEREEELQRRIREYEAVKTTATRLINEIPDNRYKAVLYHYYLRGRTLQGTAAVLHRSYQNVCQLHGRALEAFGRLMEAEEYWDPQKFKKRTTED